MKRYSVFVATFFLLTFVSAEFFAGCSSTPKRIAYNTLATVKSTTDAAFNGYLDLLVKGQVRTNDFPDVAFDYNLFQTAWSTALAVAQFSTNSFAPNPVLEAQAKVLSDIVKSKGTKP